MAWPPVVHSDYTERVDFIQNRANQTGVQTISTVTGLQAALDAGLTVEVVRDMLMTALVEGANIDIVHNDAGDTITINSLTDPSVPRRLLHNGTAYPARPAGVPAGMVDYIGPTEPTDWLLGDIWEQAAAASSSLLSDPFTGADGAAWDGTRWQSIVNTSIVGNRGQLLVPATPYGGAYAYSTASTATPNLLFKVKRPTTSNDGNVNVWLCAQHTAGALSGFSSDQPYSGYNFALYYNTTTGGVLNLQKKVPGAGVSFVSQVAYSPPRDVDYWVRAQRTGSVVQVRTWLDGSAEPSTWLGSMPADAAIPDNGVVSISANNEAAGAATVAVSIDDVLLTAA